MYPGCTKWLLLVLSIEMLFLSAMKLNEQKTTCSFSKWGCWEQESNQGPLGNHLERNLDTLGWPPTIF